MPVGGGRGSGDQEEEGEDEERRRTRHEGYNDKYNNIVLGSGRVLYLWWLLLNKVRR